jgi:hypothetical protein
MLIVGIKVESPHSSVLAPIGFKDSQVGCCDGCGVVILDCQAMFH